MSVVMKDWLDWTALVLILIGGLNWGFYSLGYDLVELTLGIGAVAKTIYALIGISALYMIYVVLRENLF